MTIRLIITSGFLLVLLTMSVVSGIIWKFVVMKRAFYTMYETLESEKLLIVFLSSIFILR